MVSLRSSPGGLVLVVGAGIAGLTAARTLQAAGQRVQVLDKGRGVGGRMATRRLEEGVLDHGAQYFTARDPGFKEMVDAWLAEGVVRVWAHGFPAAEGEEKIGGAPRYRGHPGMTAVPKALAKDLDIRLSTRVQAIEHGRARWRVSLESGAVVAADALVLTPPVPQSLALLGPGGVALPEEARAQLAGLTYHRCIALLALLDGPSGIPAPGGVRVQQGPLRWIADNRQKGISVESTAVTIHASPAFSEQYWEAADREIGARLLEAAATWLGASPRVRQVHRWRYAQPVDLAHKPEAFLPGPPALVFAGDAFGGGRVEGAALSGYRAATRILENSR